MSSKPVHTLRSEAVTEGTGDDGQLFVGTLFIGDIQADDWQTKLRVNDTPVTFKLDSTGKCVAGECVPSHQTKQASSKDQDSPNSIWRCKDNTSRRDTATSNLPFDRKKSAYEVLLH